MLTPTVHWAMSKHLGRMLSRLEAIESGQTGMDPSLDIHDIPAVDVETTKGGQESLFLRMEIRKFQVEKTLSKHLLGLRLFFRGTMRSEVNLSAYECQQFLEKLPAIALAMKKLYP